MGSITDIFELFTETLAGFVGIGTGSAERFIGAGAGSVEGFGEIVQGALGSVK